MNAQEIFDKTLFHLRKQKVASVNAEGGCMYRGPNGVRCAAGIHIPPEIYDPEMEGLTVDRLIDRLIDFPEVLDYFQENTWLLVQMQTAHDDYMPRSVIDSISRWEVRMLQIAKSFNLNYTEPTNA
jgi:hypothetical protein